MSQSQDTTFPYRLLEDAADEVARLDLLCARESPAVTLACWLATVAEATTATDSPLDTLVAAAADPIHDAALAPAVLSFRSFLAAEERRARSGAPFALSRWEVIAPGLATYPNRERLEAGWRAGSRDQPALERALDAAAWLDDALIGAERPDLPSTAIALLLCATGRTAHARFLPLGGIAAPRRGEASAAWRAGDPGPWRLLSLEGIARGARRGRDVLGRLDSARAADARAVDAMGRAGINARRALSHMHDLLATTMPAMADALDLSRPAAAAALDRLVAAGVAREVTGRARDRVFAWAAPLDAMRRRATS